MSPLPPSEEQRAEVVVLVEPKKRKRAICEKCVRPTPSACICSGLPNELIRLAKSTCFVLQHPHESRRKNRSLPLVELCVEPSHLTTVLGRRLKGPETLIDDASCTSEAVWLLFPGEGSIPLSQAIEERNNEGIQKTKLVFLDATWKYAKEMDRANVQHNCYPANMIRVQLSDKDFDMFQPRRFDIRTPPSEQHLSTAECLAWVLSRVEEDSTIYETIMKPLDLMVSQWHGFSNRKQKRPRV